MQAAIPAQAMAVPRSGCSTISPRNTSTGAAAGSKRVAHVVHRLGAALQKIGEKQNQHRLGQLRGLEGKSAGMNPAMRVVRAVEKEDGNQQQRGESHQRKHQRRMLVAPVVHAHGHDHGQRARRPPRSTASKETRRANRTAPAPSPPTPKTPSPAPRNTSSMVTVNSQRSTLTRFAMGHSFHHGGAEARRRNCGLLNFDC